MFPEKLRARIMRKSLLLACTALLTACAPALQKPEISLADIALVGIGLSEQQFIMKLQIANPNALDLPVEKLQFDIEVEGRPFAHGATAAPTTVPAHGEAMLEIMASSRLSTLSKPLRDAWKNGRTRLAYRLTGDAELGHGIGRVPFVKNGEMPLSVLEKWRLK